MTDKNTQIQKVEEKSMTPEALISLAITKGADVSVLEKLYELHNKVKADASREAFNRAMAAFQAECPTIVKTKEVFTRDGRSAYKYAPIESIVAQVKPFLQKHGFSYTTQIDLTTSGVKATCKVTHELGHTEESSMEVPLGSKTQIMSDSQVTAAASTFAKRYAFCNAFGILTGDEDNDGAKFDTEPIKDDAVPIVTYDEESPKEAHEKKYLTNTQKKKQIKDLVDSIVLNPLEQTAGAYKDYVFEQTGYLLTPDSYDEIIDTLTAVKNGEKN